MVPKQDRKDKTPPSDKETQLYMQQFAFAGYPS
jgi:hypothetical protein